MAIIKYLICSLLAAGSMTDGGWFPVEKARVGESVVEEDPSIWVLFAKSVGEDRFQVRFPDDPKYRYLESGELEVVAERDGEVLSLVVGTGEGLVEDLAYMSEGKWVREHFVKKGDRFFHFKSVGGDAEGANFDAFISSFLIEKNS